jgi:hypothetical protein
MDRHLIMLAKSPLVSSVMPPFWGISGGECFAMEERGYSQNRPMRYQRKAFPLCFTYFQHRSRCHHGNTGRKWHFITRSAPHKTLLRRSTTVFGVLLSGGAASYEMTTSGRWRDEGRYSAWKTWR